MKLRAWRASLAMILAATVVVPIVRGQGSPPTDNPELARMFREDQDDRKAGPHGTDFAKLRPRDEARLARTRELYASGALKTGTDWFHAALILQHSSGADDYLLAHEMSVAAALQGEKGGKWLAAASEDRFLMAIGRKQRFGTQYAPDESGKFQLAPTDPQLTDELRALFDRPSLAEAKADASQFDKK